MIYKLSILFLLFLSYSIMGWLLEVIAVSLSAKKVVINRGVLIGPYCPIYGNSALIIILFLNKYYRDPITLFIMATLVCALVEYMASYLLEKVYNARWWDYSHKKFNINGRICLSYALGFGISATLIMYFVNPFLLGFFYSINSQIFIAIALLLLIFFIVDNVITTQILCSLELNIRTIKKDQTEEINTKIREKLGKNLFLKKRLLNSFDFISREGHSYINRIKKMLNSMNKDKKTRK